MTSPPPSERQQSNKKAKIDVAAVAWEHYRNFLDSQEATAGENEQGDVDELVELLEILTPHLTNETTTDDSESSFRTVESLLPVLCSVAHYHLADDAIHSSVNQDGDNKDTSQVMHHLQHSLHFFPQNAATWSMGANYARMTQRASPQQVCAWYIKAAECASTLRTLALELLEGPNQVDDSIKEWIELLLLDGIVGAEFIGGDEENGDDEASSTSERDEKEGEEEGYFSSSSIEATSRFMAAMLLSTLGEHDKAEQQLQGFQLTHRLHPNVWMSTTPTIPPPIISNKLPLQEPYSFPNEALPQPLYNRLCQVLAPDAPYWKESDYAHRGYYSYFIDIDESTSPTNLMEDVIVNHLLPRAQFVLKRAGDTTTNIVGAEWWPHTRQIQANLGHQLHFDTDEALLAQEGTITHPILSSVLYLTGNDTQDNSTHPAGATIVLDQTPDSTTVASKAWKSVPRDNTFMVFPGNKLHGVLPCPGSTTDESTIDTVDSNTFEWKQEPPSNDTPPVEHRLTFMVGFWTRRVPDKMKERHLYGPCGPLPPATEQWAKQIQEGYPKETSPTNELDATKLQVASLPQVSPAWEHLKVVETNDPPLELPGGIDHRFFVRGAPEFFRESLFHKD